MAAPTGQKPKARRGPKRDLAREAQLVADAQLIGQSAAAKRHGVSERTVRRAMRSAEVEAELAARVRNLSALTEASHRTRIQALDLSWHEARERFLTKAFGRLEALIELPPSNKDAAPLIRAIADAVDRAGSLDVAHGALNVPGHGASLAGRAPSSNANGGARSDLDERPAAH